MAVPSFPFLAEIVGRSAAFTQRAESNNARRQWKAVYDNSPAALPDPRAMPGLPSIGDEHPTVPGVYLKTWEVTEEAAGAFIFTAVYEVPDSMSAGTGSGGGSDEEEEGEPIEEEETSREWSGGDTSKDLTADAVTGEAVLLPTGEPFENTPSVSVSTMTFSVTRKTAKLNKYALNANCTVNKETVTIDDVSIPPHCGLLKVSQKRIYDSQLYKWEITFSVVIVSNPVKLTPDGEVEDIGHDVALLLSGFRYFSVIGEGGNSGDLELVKATEIDEETGEANPASSPVLLDNEGKRYKPDVAGKAYYKRYAAIKEATWSTVWFR
jgi:hypothetical protein